MRRTIVFAVMLVFAGSMLAQSMSYEEYVKQQRAQYNQFKEDRQAEFDAYRKKINDEYADFMKKRWATFNAEPAVEPVKEKEVKPVVFEEESENRAPMQEHHPSAEETRHPKPAFDESQKEQATVAKDESKKEETKVPDLQEERKQEHIESLKTPINKFEPKPIAIQKDIVIVPKPEPAPEPIAPVVADDKKPHKTVAVNFYGTMVSVGFPDPDDFKITELKEAALAESWKQLSNEKYDITINNALAARENLKLSDWAYLNLLKVVTEKHYGKTPEAVYMQAFLMTQSGYRVRLAYSPKTQQLYMLFACQYDIYSMTYFKIAGQKFYAFNCNAKDLNICEAAVDKEKSLSLQIATDQKFDKELTKPRTLVSKKGVKATISVNQNNIDFFKNYPSAYIGGDPTTRWAAYANTPLEQNVREALYPQLKEKIKDLSEKDAVGLLLNWVQTAFVYEYDDKVWGHDRVFFASETLYYPYCDCEDRAILFSRLVRDLVGSDVVLLYYPGHLAAAVSFKTNVSGDYLFYNQKKYVVCDPTYINAGIGRTMPGMDNEKAKVIVL